MPKQKPQNKPHRIYSLDLSNLWGQANETFNGADFLPFTPVEFAMARLVQSHQDVTFALAQNAGDELVGTEGSITEDEVVCVNVFEKARSDRGVVLASRASLETFDATVAEIGDAHHSHEWMTTAFFLAAVLRIEFLVFLSVKEGHRSPIDGFELESAPAINRRDLTLKRSLDLVIDLNEEVIFQAHPALAIGAGAARGNRKLRDSAPSLDHGNRFGATGVSFEDLREPCPKDGNVSEVALA
ncbi:hypothetical protein N9F73_00775 [bacterium]|nr:hypothetical protein [bacterium]